MPPKGLMSSIPMPQNDSKFKLRGTKQLLFDGERKEEEPIDEVIRKAQEMARLHTGDSSNAPGSRRASRPRPMAGSRTVTPASQRLRTPSDLDPSQNVDLDEDLACVRYMHDHLRALWYSSQLQRRMCYYCAETCTDNGHTLFGGVKELDDVDSWMYTEDPESTIYKLNTGHEILLDLANLRCPCGTPFQSSPQSAICSMCCSATCSAACHKLFAQDQGGCVYYRNFLPEAQAEVHGCRDIRWCVIERCPPGTYLSRVCGPRYLEAIAGHDQNTLLLRRGYCQYGQPVATTLSRMTPLPEGVQRPLHAFRRNMCQCAECMDRHVHAVIHQRCEAGRAAREAEAKQSLSATDAGENPSLPKEHPLAVASRLGDPSDDGKEGAARKKERQANLAKTLQGQQVTPPKPAQPEKPRRPAVKPIVPIAGGKGGACDVEEDEG